MQTFWICEYPVDHMIFLKSKDDRQVSVMHYILHYHFNVATVKLVLLKYFIMPFNCMILV